MPLSINLISKGGENNVWYRLFARIHDFGYSNSSFDVARECGRAWSGRWFVGADDHSTDYRCCEGHVAALGAIRAIF